MPKQTQEQFAAFQELCRTNKLDPKADVWQQKQSGTWIIARTGIEKIQGLNNIGVDLELAAAAIDFAIVKCTATRTVKEEGARTGKKLTITSFGSAQAKNSQVSYYAEMAEKRAKSRAILMLMGFYALGVYGEDEADDFKRSPESVELPQGNAASASPTPSEPPVMRAESNSAAPVASAGVDQSIAGPVEVPADIVAKYTRQFEAATSLEEVGKLWAKLTKNEAKALLPVKEAAKVRLAAPPAPVVGNLRERGTDATLVAEFEQQPTMPTGTYELATKEQRQQIQVLLNHTSITLHEKTKGLLNLYRMDTERARQMMIKLRAAITDRERSPIATEAERIGQVKADIAQLLKANEGKLEIGDEARLRAALADIAAPLDVLEAELRWGREAAWDAESDGTERELTEAEKIAA